MPIVTIKMLEGRTTEQKSKLAKDVCGAISTSLDIPMDRVRILVEDMPKDNYSVGGITISESE